MIHQVQVTNRSVKRFSIVGEVEEKTRSSIAECAGVAAHNTTGGAGVEAVESEPGVDDGGIAANMDKTHG